MKSSGTTAINSNSIFLLKVNLLSYIQSSHSIVLSHDTDTTVLEKVCSALEVAAQALCPLLLPDRHESPDATRVGLSLLFMYTRSGASHQVPEKAGLYKGILITVSILLSMSVSS